jgi:hypothetical protein
MPNNIWRRWPNGKLTSRDFLRSRPEERNVTAVSNDFFNISNPANPSIPTDVFINSLKFGSAQYGTDYAQASISPGDSIFIGMWLKPEVDDIEYPRTSGNHEIVQIAGTNWSMQQVAACSLVLESTGFTSFYQQNGQFFGGTSPLSAEWFQDTTGHNDSSGTVTNDEALGWTYNAWQIIRDDANSQFILRQWLKFGLSGAVVKTGDEVVTYATLRASAIANAGYTAPAAAAWSPSAISLIYIGDTDSPGSNLGNITHAKLFQMATEPTTSEVDAIALEFTPDTGAWADWPLEYVNEAPDLRDVSGNSRNLSTSGSLRLGPVLQYTPAAAVTGTGSPATKKATATGSGSIAGIFTGSGSPSTKKATATASGTVTGGGGPTIINSNTAEGGTNGVTVTTGNSGGASGDAFDNVVGSPTFSNAHPFTGSMGYYSPGGGTASTLDWNVSTMTAYGVKTSFWCADLTLATPQIIIVEDGTTYDYMKVEISQWDSKAYLSRSTNESVASTVTLSNSTSYLFDMEVDNSTNSASLKIYNSSLTLLDTLNLTLVSDVDCNKVSFGTGFNSSAQIYYDSLELYDPASGGGSITGTGSPATKKATSTASGALTFSGSGSPATKKATATATGAQTFSGSGSPATKKATATASGSIAGPGTTGSGSPATKKATATGSGALTFAGIGSPATKKATASGAGQQTFSGSGSPATKKATASGTGAELFLGTGSPANKKATASASGSVAVPVTGTGSAATKKATASGEGVAGVVLTVCHDGSWVVPSAFYVAHAGQWRQGLHVWAAKAGSWKQGG